MWWDEFSVKRSLGHYVITKLHQQPSGNMTSPKRILDINLIAIKQPYLETKYLFLHQESWYQGLDYK